MACRSDSSAESIKEWSSNWWGRPQPNSTVLKLSTIVFQLLIEHHDSHNNVNGLRSSSILKLVLIALKRYKLDHHKSTPVQENFPRIEETLKGALFHFDEVIRIKGITQKLRKYLFN